MSPNLSLCHRRPLKRYAPRVAKGDSIDIIRAAHRRHKRTPPRRIAGARSATAPPATCSEMPAERHNGHAA